MLRFGRDLLNLDQSGEELYDLHARDYYHYLRSPAFVEAFLRPIASVVNRLGGACLDVGCGDAAVADLLTVPYLGIDGSWAAVRRARAAGRNVRQGRLEAPFLDGRTFPTVLFGGILEVLIRPECRVPLLELYRERCGARHFVVYDLERLDTSAIEAHYGSPLEEVHASADPAKVGRPIDHEVKLHRKILLFRAGDA